MGKFHMHLNSSSGPIKVLILNTEHTSYTVGTPLVPGTSVRICPATSETTTSPRSAMKLRSAAKEIPMEVDNSRVDVVEEEAAKDDETKEVIPGEGTLSLQQKL